MNKPYLTVAIPTYNGAERLPEILEQLSKQIDTESFDWELLIVDNNSQDNTAELIKNYQEKWLGWHSVKYCCEQRQGAAFARQKAIAESQSQWVAFLDDDIIPALNWVANAYQFSQEHPQVGAYGGQIHGDFEVFPPHDFQRIASFLAIRKA